MHGRVGLVAERPAAHDRMRHSGVPVLVDDVREPARPVEGLADRKLVCSGLSEALRCSRLMKTGSPA